MNKGFMVRDFSKSFIVIWTANATDEEILSQKVFIGIDFSKNDIRTCKAKDYIALKSGRFAELDINGRLKLIDDAEEFNILRENYNDEAATAWLASDQLKTFVMPKIFEVGYMGGGIAAIDATCEELLALTAPPLLFNSFGTLLSPVDPDRGIDSPKYLVTRDASRQILRINYQGHIVWPYDKKLFESYFANFSAPATV